MEMGDAMLICCKQRDTGEGDGMISKKVVFRVESRRNRFAKMGEEWALNAQFVGYPHWTITTWERKPATADVDAIVSVIMRSFEVYHKHIVIPQFELDAHKDYADKLDGRDG
jgi:hypothetical protein